jgi:hypothetical protein
VNQAVVNTGIAANICAAAGWPKTTAKELATSKKEEMCVGVELGGSGAGRLIDVVKVGGGFVCASDDAAAAFHHFGLEG